MYKERKKKKRNEVEPLRSVLWRVIQLLGGWWKETLELRVRLHDLGAIKVLQVLGVFVRAHALCVLSFRGISLEVLARAVLDRTTCKLRYECIHVY